MGNKTYFWIGAGVLRLGDKLLKYGDSIPDEIDEKILKRHKALNNIGTLPESEAVKPVGDADNKQLEELTEKNKLLEEQVTTLAVEKAELEGQVTVLTAENKELNKLVATQKGAITSLNKQVKTLTK